MSLKTALECIYAFLSEQTGYIWAITNMRYNNKNTINEM